MSQPRNKLQEAKKAFDATRRGESLLTPRNGLLALLALLYVLLPFDFLPDWVFPLIGWLDDLGVLSLVALWIFSHRERKLQDDPPPQSPPQNDSKL